MIYNKMLVVPKYSINRWDKDSIRPGPVGSIGEVNVQVMLRKSSVDMPNRYDPTFSKSNAAWSGSNVSDGSWYGWTSGGREATVVSKSLPNIQTGGKTAVGYVMQNIVAVDRTRATKDTPLGRYGWDTTVGSVLKSKHTGDLFLPLPGGYQKSALPRGSQFPIIIAESTGGGAVLPPADVDLTNPVFGDTGTIKIPLPGSNTCEEIKPDYTFTPAMNDPLRLKPPPNDYPYRRAYKEGGQNRYQPSKWPDIGDSVYVADIDHGYRTIQIRTDPCGGILRSFAKDVPFEERPMPGNQDRRRQDRKKEQEDDKKKKQKLR